MSSIMANWRWVAFAGLSIALQCTTSVSVDHVNATGHSPLVLPIAQTNEGKAYDVSTGFFTAPVTGLYIFRTNFMCADLTTYVQADIYVNGVYVVGSMSDCRRGYLDRVSIEVIARVQTGQKVNLDNPNDSTSVYYGHKYTTFLGFLLQADLNRLMEICEV